MVKGQSDKLKSKNFYVWMLSGVLVVVCICAVCFNVTSISDKRNTTDREKPIAENITESVEPVQQDIVVDEVDQQKPVKEEINLLENDIVDAADEIRKVDVKPSEKPVKKVKKEAVAVMSQKSLEKKLSFKEEKGLSWPVEGNVIMKYSDDKGIYFATLGQYKCNPAVIIGAEEGAKVVSAAKGIVSDITTNEETGVTVKMSIGSDYTLTYGQLQDVCVQKGDMVEEGMQIGKIAKPSKYYVVEGSNLYFKVSQKKKTVNPMYLLK